MYTQTDTSWSGIHLGTSPYTMGDSGCVVTAHAIAFLLAGWPFTPGDVVRGLNSNGCFTDNSYLIDGKPSPGLLYWGRIHLAFPQYHLTPQGRYKFLQVMWGANEHWLLQLDGTIYDPWTGLASPSMPAQYRPTGYAVAADIDQAPVTAPPAPAPVDAVQASAPAPQPSGPFWVRTSAGINVRSEPKVDSADLLPGLFLSAGSDVKIDGYVYPSDGWYDVKNADGTVAGTSNKWCKSDYHKVYFAAAFTIEIPTPNQA